MVEFIIFIIGVCIGSFVNVLGDRLPLGKDIFLGRSVCDHCKKKLGILDLIPVVSYIFLTGKCRYCYKHISIQYPVVEVAVALGFVYIYIKQLALFLPSPFIIGTIFLWIIYSLLIAIVISDWKYLIIPNSLVFAISILTLLFLLYYSPTLLGIRVVTAACSFLFLWIIYLFTKGKGMGFGDVKYSIFMGLFLGYPETIIAFYLAFLTGAGAGIILLLLGRARFGQHIPFGPFLVLATIVTFIWKNELLSLFLRLF